MNWQYWLAASRALARHLRDRGFAKEWLSAGLHADTAPRAPKTFVFFAFPELAGESVAMGDVAFRTFNLDPAERYVLAALAQHRKPKRIFEFGTYDGTTSLLLARAAPEAEVFTLDLPPESVEGTWIVDEQLRLAGGTGAAFRDAPERTRITQLLGDSRVFDFGPYAGSIDLVLVDASHEYDCVRSDTENAFRMLAPGGVIVWDDYEPRWEGVVRAVDELAAARGLSVFSLEPTSFAVYDSART